MVKGRIDNNGIGASIYIGRESQCGILFYISIFFGVYIGVENTNFYVKPMVFW